MKPRKTHRKPVKVKAPKCPKCRKLGRPDHTCPYGAEINGDTKSLCNCCDDCAYECAMDI